MIKQVGGGKQLLQVPGVCAGQFVFHISQDKGILYPSEQTGKQTRG